MEVLSSILYTTSFQHRWQPLRKPWLATAVALDYHYAIDTTQDDTISSVAEDTATEARSVISILGPTSLSLA
jgi:hypothetical protein